MIDEIRQQLVKFQGAWCNKYHGTHECPLIYTGGSELQCTSWRDVRDDLDQEHAKRVGFQHVRYFTDQHWLVVVEDSATEPEKPTPLRQILRMPPRKEAGRIHIDPDFAKEVRTCFVHPIREAETRYAKVTGTNIDHACLILELQIDQPRLRGRMQTGGPDTFYLQAENVFESSLVTRPVRPDSGLDSILKVTLDFLTLLLSLGEGMTLHYWDDSYPIEILYDDSPLYALLQPVTKITKNDKKA